MIVCAACGCSRLDGDACLIICGDPDMPSHSFAGLLPVNRTPAEPVDPDPLTRQVRRWRSRNPGR